MTWALSVGMNLKVEDYVLYELKTGEETIHGFIDKGELL